MTTEAVRQSSVFDELSTVVCTAKADVDRSLHATGLVDDALIGPVTKDAMEALSNLGAFLTRIHEGK